MESIYHWVDLIGRLWICMLLLLFAVSGYKLAKDDRGSQLFIMATLSIVLPIIQYSGVGKWALGEFSWGFPFVSYIGFVLIFLRLVLNWIGILTLKKQ